jgi:penicillin amidase
MLKRILLIALTVVLLLIGAVYFWLNQSAPQYDGEISLPSLQQPVTVHFDDFGIPHIEAENNHDLFMAFGYVHAQERLFQMEMMRRAGSGTLAEIIGQPMIKVDRTFLTLGMKEYAEASAARLEQQRGTAMYSAIEDYLAGVNYYIEHGPTPPEFSIIGITKRKFELIDLYYITGAMAFNFSMAQKTEPVIDYIAKHFTSDYLDQLGLRHNNESSIPTTIHDTAYINSITGLAQSFQATESVLPFATLNGSNAWVISGSKTKSGEVIVSNDTHIGYMVPQTWYEAHLKSPDFEMYGHYLAGVPFAMIGRDRAKAWGITMLLNDDMDFYNEHASPGDSTLFLYEGQFEHCTQKRYRIAVKGAEDTIINVRISRHGPIINDIFKRMPAEYPVAVQWTYTMLENNNLEALWALNTSTDIASFEKGVSMIHAPGLSVNYGDAEGHVAWWAAARLVERADSVNSWTMLDGSNKRNDWSGFYPFAMNPRCIDPEQGYIYSANDWPGNLLAHASGSIDSLMYPGYYKPQYRADRIRSLIKPEQAWTLEKMKDLINDSRSVVDASIMQQWSEILAHSKLAGDKRLTALSSTMEWNGEYAPELIAPTLFNRILYHTMRLAMEDEMGHELFNLFLTTHQFQRSIKTMNEDADGPWWDNITTPEKENRTGIVETAFLAAYTELEQSFGTNTADWTWGRSASVEFKHPLGEVAALRPLFSIAKRPVYGGNETIHQSGFYLDSTSYAKIFFGSQMRTMIDFADVEHGLNITPVGQSGHVMSRHYDDQAALYGKRQFREQTLVVNPSWRVLRFHR